MKYKVYIQEYNSPIGKLYLVLDTSKTVIKLVFPEKWEDERKEFLDRGFELIEFVDQEIENNLNYYFNGPNLNALGNIAAQLYGKTEFRRKVWNSLRLIGPGKTLSYKEIAFNIGCPKAFRAVGTANKLNPIPIIIPCHRVINANGAIGGYAGGLDRKEWLLHHEKVFR